MKTFEVNSKKKRFNVIYVEEKAFLYPTAQKILEKYPTSSIIPIKSYKHVFNRKNQDPLWQNQHPALILAVKEAPFLYDGPNICQSFGCERFFYTSFLLGCPFDCEYCYLQGMYPSSYTVAFVNWEDFSTAIETELSQEKDEPLFLAASYDTDLMAFQTIFPYLDVLSSLFEKKNLLFEVRTKSAPTRFFQENEPKDALLFAFSLAPDEVISRFEKNTPRLSARLQAIQAAQQNGFRVRLCFDPIFAEDTLLPFYPDFFRQVFSTIDSKKIEDISYGFFRMNHDFFRRIRKKRPNTALFLQDFPKGDIVSYEKEKQKSVQEHHLFLLSQYIEKEKIYPL